MLSAASAAVIRATREISDGMIITGTRGLVIQVKARGTEPADTAKEACWLNKKIVAGHKQVEGDFPSPTVLVDGVDVMNDHDGALKMRACRLDVPTAERVVLRVAPQFALGNSMTTLLR